MTGLRTLLRRFVEWFRTPGQRYTEVSDELHYEQELRRGVVGDAG